LITLRGKEKVTITGPSSTKGTSNYTNLNTEWVAPQSHGVLHQIHAPSISSEECRDFGREGGWDV